MALYHKHRPQTFDSVIGQDHVVETIKQQILHDRIAHAYLFSGPRGVGKTTTARILAKAVNCPGKKGSAEPDNDSECAKEINESRSIDVIEIDAASHTGVDNVRQNIIENAQFKPTKCNKKVFIIDEVHMLSTAAFNALLKTLEEPPEHVLFILATTELHKLPATIVSRCQRFAFKRVANQVIAKYLETIAKKEGIEMDAEVIKRIAKKSEGCVRDAVSLFDQIASIGKKKISLEDTELILPSSSLDEQLSFLSALQAKDAKKALKCISNCAQNGVYIERFAEELIELSRYIMIYQINPEFVELELEMDKTQHAEFKTLAQNSDMRSCILLIDLLIKRKDQISSSPIPELPLEMLIIECCDTNPETQTPSGNETIENIQVPTPKETPEKKKMEETPESKSERPKSSKNIDKQTVVAAWSKILGEVEKAYPSLGSLLKMVEFQDVRGVDILVNTEFSFHKEKLSEYSCKAKIEDIIENVLGTRLMLQVYLNEAAGEKRSSADLQELASAFGGEIIN